MNKQHFKIILIVILSLVITCEIGYIIRLNVLNVNYETETAEQTPEPLPVVGGDKTAQPEPAVTETVTDEAKIIVLDPGHGKPSSLMSVEEKEKFGWVRNSSGDWGEWRHYKSGSSTTNCEGTGCNGRVTPNGACWYPIGNGDRNTEPDINLQNALAAQKYLEKMGYTVRMTRTTNDENPSITQRLANCHPNGDRTKEPDAEVYICIHSNASGGSARGTAYISAKAPYDQAWITPSYAEDSNKLGKLCNNKIVEMTSLEMSGNGEIAWEPELVAFCKSPVPCGYLEIGFFDNSADLAVLTAESDKIGMAIAKGVDEFCKSK